MKDTALDIPGVLRAFQDDLSVRHLSILLYVHAHPGLTITEVAAGLGIPRSSMTRLLHGLGQYHTRCDQGKLETHGRGLLETRRDLVNTKLVRCYLTAEGKRLATLMSRLRA